MTPVCLIEIKTIICASRLNDKDIKTVLICALANKEFAMLAPLNFLLHLGLLKAMTVLSAG